MTCGHELKTGFVDLKIWGKPPKIQYSIIKLSQWQIWRLYSYSFFLKGKMATSFFKDITSTLDELKFLGCLSGWTPLKCHELRPLFWTTPWHHGSSGHPRRKSEESPLGCGDAEDIWKNSGTLWLFNSSPWYRWPIYSGFSHNKWWIFPWLC